MATLSVAEYCFAGGVGNFNSNSVLVPPGQEQTIVVSSGSTPCTNAFLPNTMIVRVQTDVNCAIAWGLNPTATVATSMRLSANTAEYFTVPRGANYKVAVIAT